MSRRRTIVVTPTTVEDLETVDPHRYLAAEDHLDEPGLTVLNLCDASRYLSPGWYVSLLADARGHEVIPRIDTLEALSNVPEALRLLEDAGVSVVRPALDADAVRLAPAGERVEVIALLGRTERRDLARAVGKIHRRFPVPALRVAFERVEGAWHVADLEALSAERLDDADRAQLAEHVRSRRPRTEPPPGAVRPTLAILYDDADPFRPSWDETLTRLEKVADRMGVSVRRIGTDEIDRVAEHDALFVRTLTGPDLPAFRFAQRAEALGIPVIDDPGSILRCGNKVYLAELLQRAGVPTPETRLIVQGTSYEEIASALGAPFVVKVPDGSFSTAVFKIPDRAAWEARIEKLLKSSPMLVAQRFMPTPWDWRVGVLDGKPLYAAKYYMVAGHWQIRRAENERAPKNGRTEAVPLEKAPSAVIRVACRAARLLGNGLYGVDVKEVEGKDGAVVIEVNDNPDIHHDYEDRAEGDRVYEELVRWFVARLDRDAVQEPRAPRAAIGKVRARRRTYRAYEVVGMEIEYALVDASLEVQHHAEEALSRLAGRRTSEADLGAIAFSNEFFDHLIELKTVAPMASLTESEAMLAEGVEHLARALEPLGARPMPTSMHPFFDPKDAVRWSRSGRAVYDTYARLFDTATHGWANVQSAQVNLPLGREHEAVAMMNAAALLVPYLPAVAASSPIRDGALQPSADERLAFILGHQAKIPETQGPMVPEYAVSLAAYRRDVLRPMYRAVDRLEGASAIRHEWLNARGAVFKMSRQSMEVRVIDSQECPKMDVAIAAYVRGALHDLSADLIRGRLALPPHARLVDDLHATVADGSRARVWAPHVDGVDRDAEGKAAVADVTAALIARAERRLRRGELPYLELVERVRAEGTLSERIRARVERAEDADRPAVIRAVYGELCDALRLNRPWRG